MKRKWILMLAVVPLIVWAVMAQPVANKEPSLIANQVFGDAGLLFSKDEKQLVAVRDESAYQRINAQAIDFVRDERIEIPTDSIDPFLFFSPDGKWIYQLDLDSFFGSINDMGIDYRTPKPDGKIGVVGHDALDRGSKATIRFTAPSLIQHFYGACLSGNEIIVESRQKTWYLDANDLRVLSVHPRTRTLDYVQLCPDGQTVFRRVYGHTNSWEFLDLRTEKSLWKMSDDNSGLPRFSSDGRLMLKSVKGVVIARDTRTGAEKWRLRGPQSPAIALAPSQSAVYEARKNGELWKWPR